MLQLKAKLSILLVQPKHQYSLPFKKNSSFCLYIDYLRLNKIIKKNRLALPLINKTLNYLIGIEYFIKLNLKNVFHYIYINFFNIQKIAFKIKYGYFKYYIIPFSFTNALATFQGYINKALTSLLNTSYVTYINNIFIFSNLLKKYQKYVKEVLSYLYKYQLFIDLKKYTFVAKEIEYLDFIISTNSILIDLRRIQIIAKWLR